MKLFWNSSILSRKRRFRFRNFWPGLGRPGVQNECNSGHPRRNWPTCGTQFQLSCGPPALGRGVQKGGAVHSGRVLRAMFDSPVSSGAFVRTYTTAAGVQSPCTIRHKMGDWGVAGGVLRSGPRRPEKKDISAAPLGPKLVVPPCAPSVWDLFWKFLEIFRRL